MAQKLIKINQDHYVVVDDSEIKEGDYCIDGYGKILPFSDLSDFGVGYDKKTIKKITHSTKYLNEGVELPTEIIFIPLIEVKELLGEVDVENMADLFSVNTDGIHPADSYVAKKGYMKGYNQALEDNKEKKYTEEDIRKAYDEGYSVRDAHGDRSDNMTSDEYVKSLQPKTEWEYIGECKGNNGNGCFMDSPGNDCGCYKRIPKTSWEVEIVDDKLKLKL